MLLLLLLFSAEVIVTCTNCVESPNLVFLEPLVLIPTDLSEFARLHFPTHHEPNVLRQLRHEVRQIWPARRSSGQHQALRAEVLHVVCDAVQTVCETQGLGKS